MIRRTSLALATIALIAIPALAADPVGWGGDINQGSGPRLIDGVRGELAAIVAAPEASRTGLIDTFVKTRGWTAIEATKRFRNPELRPLFLALLDHDDWRVRHRALYALEQYGEASDALPAAWSLLTHETPRLREKAAITCLKLFDADVAAEAAGGNVAEAIATRRTAETDSHVRACLDALALRAKGKLNVLQVYEEHVVTGDDGLALTPFLNSMAKLKLVAPGLTLKSNLRAGKGNAAKLGPATRWTTPLLGFGQEEVSGTSLQPFANLRGGGATYHTGLDIGACLDGAGYYAAADGFVKLIHSGSDMGTLVVLQHCTSGKQTINAVYMHGGDTVFVKPGERVSAGQLVATMGMGYSIENGGHYTHLHFGLYPGSYANTHNYGYKAVRSGLADWLDPARFIASWSERTAPLVPELPGADGPLAAARDMAQSGQYAKAWKALAKLESSASVDALRAALEKVPERLLARATKQRDLGYPDYAAELLATSAKTAKGLPGADALAPALKAWKKDAAFSKALKGAGKVAKAEAEVADLIRGGGSPKDALAIVAKLEKDYGDGVLKGRLASLRKRLTPPPK